MMTEGDKMCSKSTEVVVIGNGPSGMCLSFMLSGWTPTYEPKALHEEDLVHIRLSNKEPLLPITEMPLRELSDGLEGRSVNPVALVFDHLTHPYADTGLHLSSHIKWTKKEDRAIDHLVLGQEQPGGSWQTMQKDMKTLSRSNWIELPNMPYYNWLHDRSSPSGDATSLKEGRATVSRVQDYYQQYVKEQGLADHFISGCTVTSIQRVGSRPTVINEESGEVEENSGPSVWEVRGIRKSHLEEYQQFCIYATYVVLATGTHDSPKKLQVPGENFDYIHHNVRQFNKSFMDVNSGNPVLVVGAGLSAADAIIAVRQRGHPVLHVFRETPCGNTNSAQMLKKLPKDVYPEYTHMYRLMCNEDEAEWYTSYPNHQIAAFLPDNRVRISNLQGGCEIHEISLALVQIGSSPNLSFLPHQGTALGIITDINIDATHNPVDIDPYTYETVSETNMYAMGPLVGDNFVRFLQGGALAITQNIQTKKGVITLKD